MSVNSIILENERPKPLNSFEKFLLETDDIIQFSLVCGEGYPGSTLGYASPSGKLIITDSRMIFLPQPEFPTFKSFSCSYTRISEIRLKRSFVFSFSKSLLSAKITPVHKYIYSLLSLSFRNSQMFKVI